jgi:2-methylcitrate dehydratase PrpD
MKNSFEQLAAFVASAHYEQMPAAVAGQTRKHTLDTLGAALAGAAAVETRITREALAATEPPGDAVLWGTSLALAPRQAALVNGVAAHAYELDDTGGCDHSGAVVLPALFALLPTLAQPVSGKHLLTSIAVGYDVGRRVLEAFGGYRPHNEAGWHSTGTCGAFGAAAAAAHLLRLDPQQSLSCLGIAGSLASGLWAFIHDGSMTKKLHAGRAAESGVLAALLARQGMSGPSRLFDPVWGGFLQTLARGPVDVEALSRHLAADWRITNCAIKPHASCRDTHAGVDAVDRLLARVPLPADSIRRIEVRLNTFLAGMVGGKQITTLPAAQMSLPYAIAARILFGSATLSSYEEHRRADPKLAALIARIEIVVDDAIAGSDRTSVVIETDSDRHEELTTTPLGAPSNPVSDAALRAKYDELACRSIPAAQAERLAGRILALDQLEDARPLCELLAAPR